MEYEELEGKTITIHDNEGIVVGCDRDIGITIVGKDNLSQYLVCLIGPSSPSWRDSVHMTKDEDKAEYYKLFDILVNQIKSGQYDFSEIGAVVGIHYGTNPSVIKCPFAQ